MSDSDDEDRADGSKLLSAEDGAQLFDALANSFFKGKKDTAVGIKRQKLRALGLVSERFPNIMDRVCAEVGRPRIKVLVELLGLNIKQAMSDKKEQQMLTGCLEGLSYAVSVLDFVKAFFTESSGNAKLIFTCICSALEELVAGKLNRYHLPIAALQLFAGHAGLFKDALFAGLGRLNSVSFCKMLLDSCRHHNKEVSSKALKAYESFLGSARSELLGKREILTQICAQFQELLRLDARSKCLSLRGYGSFAAAIKSIESEAYLKDLWVELAAYMDSVIGLSDDLEHDEVNLQLPALITAFGDILIELDQVFWDFCLL